MEIIIADMVTESELEEAIESLSMWKKSLKDELLPPSKYIAYKPTYEANYYREIVIYRFIELSEAAYELYKLNHLIASIVVSRSAQETIAVFWYLNEKLKYVIEHNELSHFTEIMRRLMLGWTEDPKFPNRVNAITMIDSVDKGLDGTFRKQYDYLSEYAHPNYCGTMCVYAETHKKAHKVTFGKYKRSEHVLKSHIETSLKINIGLLDYVQEKYEENLPKVLDVCIELQKKGLLRGQISKEDNDYIYC